ncbi:MAG TPA: PhnD/SsuA/transferrin family substrate-binding protein [Gammaproteobacteria bacterium]|nr:PhnD/SsuA/transferrin family substrate-binding protein [Gammaproteobacteria bacterium]
MRPVPYQIVLFAALLAGFTAAGAPAAGNDVVIGVLAHRGDQACIDKWTPTINYLDEAIPGRDFRLLPLDLHDMSAALEQGRLDFVLTNPGNYVDMERKFGISRITTLKNLHFGSPYTVFGAVIFTRADRDDIRDLRDLEGKSFGAVAADAFGGFQMAWRELKQAGIDPYSDLSQLTFYDFPQDDIVFAVRDGHIDAGTVRAETLERMISDGRIEDTEFAILNEHSESDYPFAHSTRLYPEWAFAKTQHTSGELAKDVAIALMNMPRGHPAMIAGDYAGWTVPLNYQPVHELFMDLGIGPYRRSGMFAFRELLAHYWYWLLLLLAAVLFSAVHNILVKRQVKLRTHELWQTNRALESEVAVRKKAEEEARTLLEEKRYLAQKCMAVQEEERRYLARELHDELGQCITAIQADAAIIQDLSGACDSRLKASAGAIQGVSSRIYTVVHSLMLRYRPGVLDDLGLVETIRDEVNGWQVRQTDTVYTMNTSGDLDTLGEELNICIYRIIQESLTNIAKSAGATSVHIDIAVIRTDAAPQLRIEVTDNGAGFDPHAATGGFGLVGMRERVEALHGDFTLTTAPGKGTRLGVILPLNETGGHAA